MSNIGSEDFSDYSSFQYTDEMPLIDQFTPVTIILIILMLVAIVLTIIALWKLFNKAGDKGWKSIIPVYNIYTFFKIWSRPAFFWISLGLYFANIIAIFISDQTESVSIYLISILVMVGFYVTLTVFLILTLHQLSKSFGHGAPFTLGLIFLNTIFIMIIAFEKSKYVPTGKYKKSKKLNNE